jgi:hypothetical protein
MLRVYRALVEVEGPEARVEAVEVAEAEEEEDQEVDHEVVEEDEVEWQDMMGAFRRESSSSTSTISPSLSLLRQESRGEHRTLNYQRSFRFTQRTSRTMMYARQHMASRYRHLAANLSPSMLGLKTMLVSTMSLVYFYRRHRQQRHVPCRLAGSTHCPQRCSSTPRNELVCGQ